MIADILSGVLLGALLTLSVSLLLILYAKRRCWVTFEIAPEMVRHDPIDRQALMRLQEDHETLAKRFEELDTALAPYLTNRHKNE